MTTERNLEEIYQAKLEGRSDEEIMERFSVGLREIEKAVLRNMGVNLNLFKERPTVTHLKPKYFQLESTTVWSFKNRGKWATHNGNYRGNWSPYIPRNVILRYSEPGDLVLDQFCGGGTTAVEAKLLGRRCLARDINPSAIELTLQNLDFTISKQETLVENTQSTEYFNPSVEVGDARKLHDIADESVDLVCTHPPYANIIQYTEGLDNDISHHDVDEFIEDMQSVAEECCRVLKPDGICAILIGDTRRNKCVVPIGFRTIEAFLENGFHLKDLVIKRQHNCRTTGFWYSSSIKYNFLLLAQEYLPVFVKNKNRPLRPSQKRKLVLNYEQMKLLPTPPEMECKTTWVIPKTNFDEVRDANLLNRYIQNGRVLKILPGNESVNRIVENENYYELIYADFVNHIALSEGSLDDLVSLIQDNLESIVSLLIPNGHIAIRTIDQRMNGFTFCPVLKIWRTPEELLKIREIIVVTSEKEGPPHNSTDELEINHEYLLIYQKS